MVLPPQRDRARRLKSEPSWLTQLKLGVAIVGIVLWAYGARADIEWLRWTGIGFLAASVLVRLWFRRRDEAADDESDNAADR
jgi:hypothetical protein